MLFGLLSAASFMLRQQNSALAAEGAGGTWHTKLILFSWLLTGQICGPLLQANVILVSETCVYSQGLKDDFFF